MADERKTQFEVQIESAFDYDFALRQREKELASRERAARLTKEEEPIVKALQAVGIRVRSTQQLVEMRNKKVDYAAAIPVLKEHFGLNYSDIIRGLIARALGLKDVEGQFAFVVEAYSNEQRDFVKESLAEALLFMATPKDLNCIIDLCKDARNGVSRVLLLNILRRSKKREAKDALVELQNDPDLSKQIAEWL